MRNVVGDFEIHLTFSYGADRVAAYAAEHGLKFSHIVLDRGEHAYQPMLTLKASGTAKQMVELARGWHRKLQSVVGPPSRFKIEAAPGNVGVPLRDETAADDDPAREYFEHHIKLLLPDRDVERIIALTNLVVPHGARLSRNARRKHDDGREERFVTQRCFKVGRTTSRARLEALVEAVRAAGHQILEVEEEYVVYDSNFDQDLGWFIPWHSPASYEDRMRTAVAGLPDYPSTYLPLPATVDVRQRAAFDPSMKHFSHAYRAGEPRFSDPETGVGWRELRAAAMSHVLRLIADSRWSEHLVLRGSVTLQAWLGAAARVPGDLDFVFLPANIGARSPMASEVLDDVVALVAADPGPGLRAEGVKREEIWTYERAEGRRLVFPFEADGLPPGTIQIDVVFREPLAVPPAPLVLPGDILMLAATPELSLAWKLLWLESDMYPQGKDLYDAALLAEFTTVSPELVREVLRKEVNDPAAFGPESVLAWNVDWRNFADEYPGVEGDAEAWQQRLALALLRSYR